jgi:hypothetical protein
MDDDLGLSERDKELKKWNAPYVYREFPKMVFRGVLTSGGRVEYEHRVVGSVSEESAATATGWDLHPQRALDRAAQRAADVGVAAAERAWDDRHLSAAAQAEAAAIDAGTAQHVPEILVGPKRKAPRREE